MKEDREFLIGPNLGNEKNIKILSLAESAIHKTGEFFPTKLTYR